jgi:hypothetical protein
METVCIDFGSRLIFSQSDRFQNPGSVINTKHLNYKLENYSTKRLDLHGTQYYTLEKDVSDGLEAT